MAIQRFDEVISLTDNTRATVAAYIGLGWTFWQRGSHEIARQHLERGLSLARRIDDQVSIKELILTVKKLTILKFTINKQTGIRNPKEIRKTGSNIAVIVIIKMSANPIIINEILMRLWNFDRREFFRT